MLPALHPYVGCDLTSTLTAQAVRRGDHPFVIWAPPGVDPTFFTYADIGRRSAAISNGFKAEGLKPGDRLLVLVENCPEQILTLFAAARLGAVTVMLNSRSSPDEVAHAVRHSGATIAVTQPELVDRFASAGGLTLIVTGADFDALGAVDEPIVSDRIADPGADLCIQYTSGTTARPKGVVWTHANALWAGQVNARHTGLRADDVYLVHLPLFHTNALAYSLLGTLWVGGTVVLVPRFSASRFWEVSLTHGCTVTSMIPFCVRALADQPVPEHRYRVWGSPICDPPYDAHFGVKSIGWWGMTETVSHGIVGDPDQANVPLSCGRPAPEYEVRVLDAAGQPVAPGQTGSLHVRGVRGLSLFDRYLDDESATAAAFDDDGWFLTGDRVTLLADGHLAFADREKDVLKVAGENVSAMEVERVVLTVPGVADVAVVGRPDPMRGEVAIAFVVPQPEVEQDELVERVLATCAQQLADFKVPRLVVLADELPRATLNKVAKAQLRTRAAELVLTEANPKS